MGLPIPIQILAALALFLAGGGIVYWNVAHLANARIMEYRGWVAIPLYTFVEAVMIGLATVFLLSSLVWAFQSTFETCVSFVPLVAGTQVVWVLISAFQPVRTGHPVH